jgi:hypothetical protein
LAKTYQPDLRQETFDNDNDELLVAASFDLTVPPADMRADINGDGIVNVQDLAILGSNYGLSGD